MSNLLKRLSNEMKSTLTWGELIVVYATILHEEGKLYHFDDDPFEIDCFSKAEAMVVRLWTRRLHSEKLFQVALKLHDPNYDEAN